MQTEQNPFSDFEEFIEISRLSIHQLADLIQGYRIFERIGESQLAILYKAQQTAMDRTVVIKILKPKLCKNTDSIKRFLREIHTFGRLGDHPYILQAFDSGQFKNLYYVVTEFRDGIPLDQYKKGRGKFPELEALILGQKILEGLIHLWKNHLVYRELVPKNILISNNQVKLCDFGLVGILSNKQQFNQTTIRLLWEDTPFLSPELLKGEELDFRSDIYSLGCIVYWLLTGQTPHSVETLQNICSFSLPTSTSIRTFRPKVQKETDELVSRMLAFHAKDRFSSIGEIETAYKNVSGIKMTLENTGYKTDAQYKHTFHRPYQNKKIFLCLLLAFLFSMAFYAVYRNVLVSIPVKKNSNSVSENQYIPISLGQLSSQIYNRCAAGIVLIQTPERIGSGIIISHKNSKVILTNEHVIRGRSKVECVLNNNQTILARIKKIDTNLDLALLEIIKNVQECKTILELEKREVTIGEDILIIGHPRNYRWSLSKGTISGIRGDTIQTDASIHPGNSGGAMLNCQGKVVGITSYIVAPERPIGFAIAVPSILKFLSEGN